MNRLIMIFVRDRAGNPLPGSTVRFTLDGKDAGEVPGVHSEGRGSIETPPGPVVEVSCEYDGQIMGPIKLSSEATSYEFSFPVTGGYSPMKNILPGLAIVVLGIILLIGLVYLGILSGLVPLVVGAILIAVALFLAFQRDDPSLLQQQMIRSLFALGLGAAASAIPGILDVKMSLGGKAAITAGGAIAVWLIAFFFVPARDR